MKKRRFNFYRFLPVQLFLLHFRRYQLLLVFWWVLFSTIFGSFMSHFGASSLFLAPEYLGSTNFLAFFLLGGATSIFIMSWHITTFIIHGKKIPFLGATRQAFLKYCLNNSALPIIFLIAYAILASRYLLFKEGYHTLQIILFLLSFAGGLLTVQLISFLFFFSIDRNILKTVLSSIRNISSLTEIIPFDALDSDYNELKVNAYWNSLFSIKQIKRPYEYNARFLVAVLRRHNRNAVFAIVIAFLSLLILGQYMDLPVLRIPAGCGFLLLFSIMLAFVASFKYLLRSWEIIGWIVIFLMLSFWVKKGWFDIRGVAYGINYSVPSAPVYDYEHLKQVFSLQAREEDLKKEENRLVAWKRRTGQKEPPLVVIAVSGGGSRSAYWSFRCLQYADSLSGGALFKHTVLLTGASGGMIGAAYWRSVHTEGTLKKIQNVYDPQFQTNIGKDLLNSIVFSMAAVDFIAPFSKITVNGRAYRRDRGYAFDEELVRNTRGLLGHDLAYYRPLVAGGISPLLIANGSIINDGRKLMIASQPISYMTMASYNAMDENPVIDAVDFQRFFKDEDPLGLQLASALRVSASFPIILPVVKMPSQPEINVMDAGLRDNYGLEIIYRYLDKLHPWLVANTGNVVFLQIRDTKETNPSPNPEKTTLMRMLLDPLFAIQQKWSSFQTFEQTYLTDQTRFQFDEDGFKKIVLEFEPNQKEGKVALNFHLSDKDKTTLNQAIHTPKNQQGFQELIELLRNTNP